MAQIPIFMDITEKRCVVAGGGKVALRKIETLLAFGGNIFVVAPSVSEEIKQLEGVTWEEREYERKDLETAVLVIAATDNQSVNHNIAKDAKEKNVLVNVVNIPKESSFFFPAYTKRGDVVVACSSGGKAPVVAQYIKKKTALEMTEQLEEANDFLGAIRPQVKKKIAEVEKRRQVYQELLKIALTEKRKLTQEDVDRVVNVHTRDEL